MSNDYQPLHHKYRPDRFSALVGQEAIAATLKQAIISNRIAPAYLFCGPRGTGKTSSARILARSLNCLKSKAPTIDPCGNCEICQNISSGTALDVIEIDAASNTGVENIRDLIDKSQFAPVQARWKVYVIDECHMLSTAAFNALLKTLEEPPSKVVFVLATTDPQRVLPTIISRCMRFDFRRIPLADLTSHLQLIAQKESIEIEIEAIDIIAKKAQGGLRDAESMLDQLSLLPYPINVSAVWDLLGTVPETEIITLVKAINQKDPLTIIETTKKLLDYGKEPLSIVQGLASIIRDLILIKVAPEKPQLCNISKDSVNKLSSLVNKLDMNMLLQWQSELKNSENQLRHSLQPRLWLEVILLGIIATPKINQEHNQNNNKNTNKLKLFPKEEKDSFKDINNEETINKLPKQRNSKEPNLVVSNPSNDLLETWNQIISMLELPSTKMLLSQQANLINLTTEKAEIRVASKWVSMIESRKSLIEKAISKALGGNRKLILITEKSNTSNVINESTIKQKKSDHKSTNKELIPQKLITTNKSPSWQVKEKQLNNEDKASKHKSIDNQAKQFADFFNGKIIDLDEK